MIIWISGPINAGKSTVAGMLAASRPRTVHIEIDHLRGFAECLSLEESIPFCVDDSAMLTRNWIARGFDVVLSWPISGTDLHRFAGMVPEPVRAFTLLPPIDIALSRRGERSLTEWERERITEMYASTLLTEPVGILLDNSEERPEQTVERIVAVLAER